MITGSGPFTFCEGDDVILFSSGNENENWSNGHVGQLNTISTSGMYHVVSTTNAGCSTSSDTIEIIVNLKPIVNIQANLEVCEYNDPFELVIGSPTGGNYSGNGITGNIFYPSATGVSATIVTYTIIDNNNCEGSAQGVVIVDDCADIKELYAEGLKLYPNPSYGKFKISSELMKISKVEIIDAVGKIIFSEDYHNLQLIDIDQSTLPNGAYQVIITSDDLISSRIPLIIHMN